MIEHRPSQYREFTEASGWFILAKPDTSNTPTPSPTDTAEYPNSALDTEPFSFKALADKVATAPLREFHRDEYVSSFVPVEMIPLGKNGERKRYHGKSPRNQPLVIGVDHMNGYVGIAYEKGQNPIEGYHAGPDNYMIRLILERRAAIATTHTSNQTRNNRFVVLHGAIIVDPNHNTSSGEKARHILELYAMHPEDLKNEGGERARLQELDRNDRSWEKGGIVPHHYVGEHLAQRLMVALDANQLRVVHAQRAHHIYQAGTSKPLPRQFREGD